MRALILAAALCGCYMPIHPGVNAVIKSKSLTLSDGVCAFAIPPQIKDPWVGSDAEKFGWIAPCDSFEVGDTVWLEVRKK